MREIRGIREEDVQFEPHPGRDEEDRDEHTVTDRLELLAELRMTHRLVAIDELDDATGEEGAENRLKAEPLGKHRVSECGEAEQTTAKALVLDFETCE